MEYNWIILVYKKIFFLFLFLQCVHLRRPEISSDQIPSQTTFWSSLCDVITFWSMCLFAHAVIMKKSAKTHTRSRRGHRQAFLDNLSADEKKKIIIKQAAWATSGAGFTFHTKRNPQTHTRAHAKSYGQLNDIIVCVCVNKALNRGSY